MLHNILEVIDYILDEKSIEIFFVNFPLNGEGLLIESSNNKTYESLDGLSDLHFSHIQFFVRISKKKMSYIEIDEKLKALYNKVYNSQNQKIENFEIINVTPFEQSSFSVESGEFYIVSLDFNIDYRKGF